MNKYSSQDTTLKVDISGTYTTVPGWKTIDFPDGEVVFMETTDLLDTEVKDGELAGLSTPGSVNMDGFWDPAETVQLLLGNDRKQGGVHRDWKLIASDTGASEVIFEGAVAKWQPKAAAKEALGLSAGIKLRSVATFPA